MRTVNLTIDAKNQSASVKAFKALRTVDASIEMGPTLAKCRAHEVVLSIETDCREWNQRLSAILELLTQLESHDIGHSMTMVELFPVPIGSGPPPSRDSRTIARSDVEAALEFERSIEVTSLPQRVLDFIQEVQNADWFVSVGNPMNEPTVFQGSIDNAQNEQPLFEEASLEYQNVLSATLCYNFHYHYNRCWNEVVRLLQPLLDDLIAEKLKDALVPISDYLRSSVRATIQSASMEHFFAPQVPISTHSSWVEWLIKGHIPYAWQGDFANGTLVVV